MPDVQPVPDGYTAATLHLVVEDAAKAIELDRTAFGAQEPSRGDLSRGSRTTRARSPSGLHPGLSRP